MNPDVIPFRQALRALSELAQTAGVEMILVGATARDIALGLEGHGAPLRATNDVDVAVAVADAAAFGSLTSSLVRARIGAEHKFLVQGVEVDIVPFGGIESDDRTITWPDGAVMNTLGIAEAFQCALRVDLGADQTLLVASLAAQTALKLFAWADRRSWTDRDAVDLRSLIHAYSDADRLDAIYADENVEILARYDYAIREAGSHVLGTIIRADLGRPVAHRCIEVLGDEDSADEGRMAAAMREDTAANSRLLRALRNGLATSGPGA